LQNFLNIDEALDFPNILKESKIPVQEFFILKVNQFKKQFSKIFTANGYDLEAEDEINFYKTLFYYGGSKYSGVSRFLPSVFESQRGGFLTSQEMMFERIKKDCQLKGIPIPVNFGNRYLIPDIDNLHADIRAKYYVCKEFVRRHENMHVQLFWVSPENAKNAIDSTTPSNLLDSRDVGLWHDSYAVRIEELHDSFYLSNEVTQNDRRRLIFADKDTDLYDSIKQYIEIMNQYITQGAAIRIDYKYLDHIYSK